MCGFAQEKLGAGGILGKGRRAEVMFWWGRGSTEASAVMQPWATVCPLGRTCPRAPMLWGSWGKRWGWAWPGGGAELWVTDGWAQRGGRCRTDGGRRAGGSQDSNELGEEEEEKEEESH